MQWKNTGAQGAALTWTHAGSWLERLTLHEDSQWHNKIFSFQIANESYWRHDEPLPQQARVVGGSGVFLRRWFVGVRHNVSGSRAICERSGAGGLGRFRRNQFPVFLLRFGRAKTQP